VPLSPSLDGKLLEGDDKASAVRSMFDRIAPRYDLVNRIMTFRFDIRWRKLAVEALALDSGSLVLDLACGTGDMCIDLEAANLHPVGIDFSSGMLASSRTHAQLLNADVLRLPVSTASVDGVTCGFALRNFTDLGKFFDEVARVTRPGAAISLLDASEPDNQVLRLGHGLYFKRLVPAIGGLLSDRSAYAYLPKSLAYLPTPAVMKQMLQASGFENVTGRQLTGGAAQLLTATRAA